MKIREKISKLKRVLCSCIQLRSLHLIIYSLIAFSIHNTALGVPVDIVEVSAPDINCFYDLSCSIVVDDEVDEIVLPDTTGHAFIQSRLFVATEGAPAYGQFGYLYRIDLRNLAGNSSTPCINSLSFITGPISQEFDYDLDGDSSELVFVVTSGGLGTVKPSSASINGDLLVFEFSPSVCAGGPSSMGESSFFFGFTSTYEPKSTTGRLTLDTDESISVEVVSALNDPCDFFVIKNSNPVIVCL